jgi:hypothetical protein
VGGPQLPLDVLEMLLSLPSLTQHGEFQRLVASGLTRLGFRVQTELPVPNRGDGRTGRIDLLARRGPCIVALELDRKSPRRKSLYKLRHLGYGSRAVVLRCG